MLKLGNLRFSILLFALAATLFLSCGDAPKTTGIDCLKAQYGKNSCETDADFMERKIKDFETVQKIPRAPGESDEEYVRRVVAMAQAWTF